MARILLIDDDSVLLKLYKTRLEKDQLQVEVALNGEEGFTKAQGFTPDIIILDLMMPKVNGFKFLEQCRSHAQLKSTPIVVFSSLIRPEQTEYLKKMGVKETINKIDVTPTQLVETIHRILNQSKT